MGKTFKDIVTRSDNRLKSIWKLDKDGNKKVMIYKHSDNKNFMRNFIWSLLKRNVNKRYDFVKKRITEKVLETKLFRLQEINDYFYRTLENDTMTRWGTIYIDEKGVLRHRPKTRYKINNDAYKQVYKNLPLITKKVDDIVFKNRNNKELIAEIKQEFKDYKYWLNLYYSYSNRRPYYSGFVEKVFFTEKYYQGQAEHYKNLINDYEQKLLNYDTK